MFARLRQLAAVAAVASLGALAAAAPTSARAVAASDVAVPAAAGVYTIDATHSELQFRIRHLVSRVNGTFNDWKGTITVPDENRWESATIDVTIQTASIDTKNERRDTHLRTSDFFQADSFPTITFKSTRIERSGDAATIHGTLTMRGVTKEVTLDVKGLERVISNGKGGERMGLSATGKVSRKEFGISWVEPVLGGGVNVGDEVVMEIEAELIRSVAPPAK